VLVAMAATPALRPDFLCSLAALGIVLALFAVFRRAPAA